MNRDQLFSALNWALAMGATWLMARGFDQGTTKAIIGLLALVISFALAWWMNHGVFGDIVISFVRRVLGVVFGYLTFRGIITQDTADVIITGAMTIVPVVMSMWGYSKFAGPNLPGTTIVDPPSDTRGIWLEPKIVGTS